MNTLQICMAAQQVATGLFFAISGYHKLANKDRHAALVSTLKEDRVPFLKFNEWWVPGNELVWGAALAVGAGRLAAGVLTIICLVACAVDAPARVRAYKPLDKADTLDDWLYLPEVLYAVMLVTAIFYGSYWK